jgi:hypothetical protein
MLYTIRVKFHDFKIWVITTPSPPKKNLFRDLGVRRIHEVRTNIGYLDRDGGDQDSWSERIAWSTVAYPLADDHKNICVALLTRSRGEYFLMVETSEQG